MGNTCKVKAAHCVCINPPDRQGDPHQCECTGAWSGDHGTDTFEPVTLPPFRPLRFFAS
jgi:hypothetical protein